MKATFFCRLLLLFSHFSAAVKGKSAVTSPASNVLTDEALKRCEGVSDPLLTLIVLYHNECTALRYQSSLWAKYSPELLDKLRFLIIDDNSQIPASRCVANEAQEINLSVVRIDSRTKWNIGGGRNLGAYVSCSPFIFFLDMDAFAPFELIRESIKLLDHTIQREKHWVQYNRKFDKTSSPYLREETISGWWRKSRGYGVHPGVMLMSRELYWKAHGCDEDFVGNYGQTDPHLRYRIAQMNNTENVRLLSSYLQYLYCPADDMNNIPFLNRSTHTNKQLIELKKDGKIPWNYTVLRFNWHEGNDRVAEDMKREEVDEVMIAAALERSSAIDSCKVKKWHKVSPSRQ